MLGRSKLKTLKDTTLKTFFELSSKLGLSNQFEYNQQSGTITFWNGSEIILKDLFYYPSDPNFDSLGSLEITGAFIDECNQIDYKAWQITKSRIRFKLDEYGLIPKILGTCNPSKNWVYSEFFNKDKNKTIEENKVFLQSLATDNPFLSKHYIENLKTLDEASKKRLLYGDWDYDDDPTRLIESDALFDMFTNTYIKEGTDRILSCDIAGRGADKFVFTVWFGWVIKKVYAFKNLNSNDCINKIREIAELYQVRESNIIFDADGIGSFVDGFIPRSEQFINNSKPIGNDLFYNLKSQCGYKLADLINDGAIYCEDQQYKQEIISDLGWLKTFEDDKDTKKRTYPKKLILKNYGKSPDFMDSIMFRIKYYLKKSINILDFEGFEQKIETF